MKAKKKYGSIGYINITHKVYSKYIIFAHSYHVLNKYEKKIYVFRRLKLHAASVTQFFYTQFRDRVKVFFSYTIWIRDDDISFEIHTTFLFFIFSSFWNNKTVKKFYFNENRWRKKWFLEVCRWNVNCCTLLFNFLEKNEGIISHFHLDCSYWRKRNSNFLC